MGNPVGGIKKDYAANAAWAGATGGQNPYTNAPGASAYDKSGLIPGNEPGSTLPRGPAPSLSAFPSFPASAPPVFPSFPTPTNLAPGQNTILSAPPVSSAPPAPQSGATFQPSGSGGVLGGVNFAPGGASKTTSADKGVQEAIQVLSLRLPSVVGAQAVAPSALLNSAGSGGNPRVDSVVNTVMNRMFPTGQAPSGQAPMMTRPQPGESGTERPSPPVRFDGVQPTPMIRDLMPSEPWAPPPGFTPRVVVDNQLGQGDFTTGGPPPFHDGSGQPPAAIAPRPDPFALMDFLWRSDPPPSAGGPEY